MKQFLLPQNLGIQENLELRGADYHYLVNVRRMRQGDDLSCRTPDGRSLDCRISSIGQSGSLILTVVSIVSEVSSQSIVAPTIQLLLGMPKGKKLDQIIRQSVEIGVNRIQILNCKNSVVDLDEKWDRKSQRYETIIKEAMQQSGAKTQPELGEPCTIRQYLETHTLSPGELGIFFHEKELEQSSLHGYLGSNPSSISMVVGPEGGLAAEEVALLKKSNFKPVFLGEQVLRCETAAIVGLGLVKLITMEYPFWMSKES